MSRWLPAALTIDLAGLLLTIVFWYALTESLRRLGALKDDMSSLVRSGPVGPAGGGRSSVSNDVG
jgi:hypothetical protein